MCVIELRCRTGVYQGFILTFALDLRAPWDATQAPDYYTVISKPVDLSRIWQRIRDKVYHSIDTFSKDIRQMLDNCRLYNAPGTAYFGAAEELQQYYKRLVDKATEAS